MKTSKKNADSEKVYLVPNTDGTWKTMITDTLPTSDAAVITTEGTYPVDIYYHRIDLNGSCTLEKECCQTREELTSTLDWLGKCGSAPLSFWTFDHNAPMDGALIEILNNSYDRGYQQRQQALREIESEMEHYSRSSLISSSGTNPEKTYSITLTKDEMDKLIQALDVMGDRMADREGYSAGEGFWDLKEKLEELEAADPKQKPFGQIINDAQTRSSTGKSPSHTKSKEDELEK